MASFPRGRAWMLALAFTTACSGAGGVLVLEVPPDAGVDAAVESGAVDAPAPEASGGDDAPTEGPSDAGADHATAPYLCAQVDPSLVASAIGCSEGHCSTAAAGDPSGRLFIDAPYLDARPTDCLVQDCPAQWLNLQGAGASGAACYGCLVGELEAGATFGEATSYCGSP